MDFFNIKNKFKKWLASRIFLGRSFGGLDCNRFLLCSQILINEFSKWVLWCDVVTCNIHWMWVIHFLLKVSSAYSGVIHIVNCCIVKSLLNVCSIQQDKRHRPWCFEIYLYQKLNVFFSKMVHLPFIILAHSSTCWYMYIW